MKHLLAILLLASSAAFAQTTVPVPANPIMVPVPAATFTGPNGTINVPAYSLPYTVPAYTLTIQPVTPPPTCPDLPAPLTQSASCPTGFTGSYQQTATYSAAAYPVCGVLGAYTPVTPPAGACTAVVVPPPPPPVASNCGNMLGGAVTFCETFDAPAGIAGTRSGDLNSDVWGVSRAGGVNFGQQNLNLWNATVIQKCDGTAPIVVPPADVIICNGQLREASNDNNTLQFEDGGVTSLAMYPKQPFDFAGRTGTISFDVSNDTAGFHAAWPELWMSDAPVPDPFNHFDSWESLPQNGFVVRFGANCDPGQQCICPNANNETHYRWTVDSVAAVRGYVLDDTNGYGPRIIALKTLDCVIESTGPGNMNHVEVQVSQGQIDVYATDAGVAATPATLRHIATATTANLTFTRGLVWLEDVHYNADKGDPSLPTQRQHTFTWDNVAFDGPFTDRDFAYDAPDNTVVGPNGAINLGRGAGPNQLTNWNIANLPANPQAAAAKVLFNFNGGGNPNPTVLNVIVNGHAHPTPWPYPDQLGNTWRTFVVQIALTDLVAGTNVVQLGADQALVFSNVDIVLGDVTGAVPVLPGSVQTFP